MFYLIFRRNLLVWNDYKMISQYNCNNFKPKNTTKIHCNCSTTPITTITFKVPPWLCLTCLYFVNFILGMDKVSPQRLSWFKWCCDVKWSADSLYTFWEIRYVGKYNVGGSGTLLNLSAFTLSRCFLEGSVEGPFPVATLFWHDGIRSSLHQVFGLRGGGNQIADTGLYVWSYGIRTFSGNCF